MSATEKPIFIVVDDAKKSVDNLSNWAADADFQPIACSSAAEAVAAINQYAPQGRLVGVVTDLKLGAEHDGWRVICHAYGVSKSLRLALYTGYASDPVQEVFQRGVAVPAFTVFARGDDDDALKQWLLDAYASWKEGLAVTLKDANTREIYTKLAPIYARSNLNILLLGESGTGKESLSKHLHGLSNCKDGPFRSVNCGGLEPSLAFAQMFGHTANAFTDAMCHDLGVVLAASGYNAGSRPPPRHREDRTFLEWFREANPDLADPDETDSLFHSPTAEHNAGTLFLDEVATMPRNVMAGVLRLLSTKDVQPVGHLGVGFRSYCRVISATNEVDVLNAAVKGNEGASFRRDLCYRLGGAVLTLPPLRERGSEDIVHFASYVVWKLIGLPPMEVDKFALEELVNLYQKKDDEIAKQYQAGNFRSLRDLIHRAALLALADGAEPIVPEHIKLAIRHGELRVEDSLATTQAAQIRELFRQTLISEDIQMKADFSWKDLRVIADQRPVEVGLGFIRCALSIQCTPTEIEIALSKDGPKFGSRGKLCGKGLTNEHVFEAAVKYYPEFKEKFGAKLTTISVTIDNLRGLQISAPPQE